MEETITKTQYPESARGDFLFKHIGTSCIQFEMMVFHYMDAASTAYTGGFWEFYTLSNGGFYMAYDSDKRLPMRWEMNGYSGEMSADAASIAVNLMALAHSAELIDKQPDRDRLIEGFHALRGYADQHPEGGQIFAFID